MKQFPSNAPKLEGAEKAPVQIIDALCVSPA